MYPVVDTLDRFSIEAVYAFRLCNCNTANAADLMHISPGAMYNDLVQVRNKLGLNPYEPTEFEQIYDMVEAHRKEQMHGKEIDIGGYLCGE